MVHKKIKDLLQLPQHEQRSPEWFAQRKDKLTSSDAATVLGTNPYSKPHELLFHKCGHEKPFVGNVATLHGQKYEDTAIELYCRITGKRNFNFGLICYADVHKNSNNHNPEHDFLAGSPDGIVESIDNSDEEPILLEVKCPYKRPVKDGYIPIYYYPQVQLNLYICNLTIADFIEYIPKTNKLNIVRVKKDYDWLNKNILTLSKFWKDVVYYRGIGVENHPEFIKKIEREKKRETNKEKRLEKDRQKELKELNKKQCIIIDESNESNEEQDVYEQIKNNCLIID
jgi:putative phage-type endonuclease